MGLVTTRSQMRQLKDGELFVAGDAEHVADGDAHVSGDASYDGYIVYDQTGESWLEDDFPE